MRTSSFDVAFHFLLKYAKHVVDTQHYNVSPVRIGHREDEEVKHVEETVILGVGHQVVHHVRHRGRANPLTSVDS